MMHLSYQEAYVLEFVSQMNECTDPNKLLGLYVCHFLDDLEAREEGCVDDYFLHVGEEVFNKNLFYPVLKKLVDLNLLKMEKERIFKHFSRVRLMSEGGRKLKNIVIARSDLNEFILDAFQKHKPIENISKMKSLITVFNAKLFSFLHSFEGKDEKFELRLFWPENGVPEVYDMDNLFEEGKYKKNREEDQYIIEKENTVLKVRGDELHEKSRTLDFYGIERFTKKRKVDISSDKKTVLQGQAVEVSKKRYLYKGDSRLKIEFATLKVHGEKWRTICIESPSLQTVLALSLLINSEHGERLNYTAFVERFYSVR